jgi:hypothetical protein
MGLALEERMNEAGRRKLSYTLARRTQLSFYDATNTDVKSTFLEIDCPLTLNLSA